MTSPIRIGTRASPLAQIQARQIQAAITHALGLAPDQADTVAPLVLITTSGDRIQDRRLLEIGGKALFTKEIEAALLHGDVDCAVHSLKDVPAERQTGLTLAAFPEREDPRDAFISIRFSCFEDLPQGARLGTASLRRAAQALYRRPDLRIVMLRGNVQTRLAKLEAGECDATLLALSGLKRLGLEGRAKQLLDPVAMPPAPGQGCLALETRSEDAGAPWVTALRHERTSVLIAAERGALEALEGSCKTAIGAFARIDKDEVLVLTVEALTPDGSGRWRREENIPAAGGGVAALALGFKLGRAIRDEAGDKLQLA
jgi:hydroxymethylbilane synthase